MSAIALLVCLGERDRDVVRHETALHEHPGLICNDMQDADERSWRPFYDLYDLSFPALVGLLAGHRHAYHIPMKGSSCLGRLYENIIVLAFYDHERVSLTGHLHLAHELRENLLFLLSSATTFAVRMFVSSHNYPICIARMMLPAVSSYKIRKSGV